MTGGGGVGGVVSVCTLPGVVALRLCPLMLESSLPRCGVTALGVAAAAPSPADSEKSRGANSCSPRSEWLLACIVGRVIEVERASLPLLSTCAGGSIELESSLFTKGVQGPSCQPDVRLIQQLSSSLNLPSQAHLAEEAT